MAPKKPKLKLTDQRLAYKPFQYPRFYEMWKQHEQAHWLSTELQLHDDVKDWQKILTTAEKYFLTQIFRFFTQGDLDVAGAYVHNYLPVFPQPEVRMMLLGFAAREAVHIDAYSHLIETLGMPDTIYSEFMEYEEMKQKHDYVESFIQKDASTIAQQIAVFSAFTEGMQLFSSFVMLLNFPRQGKMNGMGEAIIWSIRDESMHCDGMTELFRTFIKENRDIWTDELKRELYTIAERMVELEDKFIDLSFSMGAIQGLTSDELKQYIRYIADRRLIALGLKGIFKVKVNPLPWVDMMTGAVEQNNFFERKGTSYAKGALSGSWGDVWG